MRFKKYIARCLRDPNDYDGYISDRDILFLAVDFLGQAADIHEITWCMADISSCCARLLLFGSRKIEKLRRKEGKSDG